MNQHNLNELLRSLSNRDFIQDDLAELQRLVINENYPRYPQWNSTRIPHDNYNQNIAERALEIARRVLSSIAIHFNVE